MNKKYVVSGAIGLALISAVGAWASYNKIKKGSFTLELGTSASANSFATRVKLQDVSASDAYKVNSPVGEYGILYANNSVGPTLKNADTITQTKAGLIFYQAGIVVVTASIFSGSDDGSSAGHAVPGLLSQSLTGVHLSPNFTNDDLPMVSGANNINDVLSGSAISGNCDVLRRRIYNIQFNNTTELNSTIYFCRAAHNEFNYSANPTYITSSKIVVKNNAQDIPVAYATAVGLYSPDNELLAVAKLSEPMKKDPSNEFTVRVRLDY